MIDEITKLQSLGLGNVTLNTLANYYHIYLKYDYYRQFEDSKMQCYTNVSEELNIGESTVRIAVKTWLLLISNNELVKV